MIETGKLARLELFEGLPDEALAAIAEISREMGFEAGEIIFSPEMQSTKAFLLVEGSVRLTVHAPPLPGPVMLAVVGTPGQPFGFSSLVGQVRHNSSAAAITHVSAVAIEGPALLAYLESNPAVGFTVMRRVARAISRRLASLRRQLLDTIVDYERQAGTTAEN